MGKRILIERPASLVVPGMAALHVACVQERGACAEACGAMGDSSAQVNVAPDGTNVVAFVP